MQFEINSRADLTLDLYRRVAWQRDSVKLGAKAMQAMAESRARFLRLLEDPAITIYGVTSGYGHMASIRLEGEARRAHARKPPRASVAAFGPPAPDRVARGIVLARLANFVEGHAAVTPALAAEVAAMLNGAPMPQVSMAGQGGAGEILWAAPLFIEIAERFDLGEKDALSLINGSPAAAALIADAAIAMRRRLDLVERVFALSAEAIKAPLEAYDEAFDDLWEDPHEAEALRRLRALLQGGGVERRKYQAPVSYRILPRVIGQFRRVIAQAEEIAASSLRSVTDNPVFLPADAGHPNGRIASNGGYHNARAYPALDNLAAACVDLCVLAERHTTKLLDGRYSLLPDQLQDGGGHIGILGFVQIGYAEEARRHAQRTFLPGSEAGGFGQNDVAPLTGLAWRAQEEAGRCLDAALTMLSAVASQAFHVTGREAPPELQELLSMVRAEFPPVTGPQTFAAPLEALMTRLRRSIYDA
ncbi:MAG TPA: aromatic amino acid lyase [Dongiaceae bacterium]|nr:aromatic amino acid lyase [Dongiaceae bacterium]